MNQEQIVEVEKGFWGGDANYFQENVSDSATFVFPGMRLSKEQSIDGVKNNPQWDQLEVEDISFQIISDTSAILTYRATGKHNEGVPYNAYITSVYKIENDKPVLLFHQHTPDME